MNTSILLKCFNKRLFFLTTLKPLKQYTFFEKNIHSAFRAEADI